jgi:hypothetical protein
MTPGARTSPTTDYWQTLHEGWPGGAPPPPPFRLDYPVRLPDGRVLVLPLRRLPEGRQAVASLIANQASFAVVAALSDHMTKLAREAGADLIVGMPTLGLTFAPLVAERLGHARYVPLGYSRKFWYDDALSEPIFSITSPSGEKRLYLDPNVVPLLKDAHGAREAQVAREAWGTQGAREARKARGVRKARGARHERRDRA